jgi:succinyl-CoA synthetase alpha subunit
MMGTPTNIRIMTDAGLLDKTIPAVSGGDLVIAIVANDRQAADHALEQANLLLDKPIETGATAGTWRPRTIESAHRALPGANLALISVAGDYAAAEARKALRLGLHVIMFSDNVSVEEEADLKRQARELGLLVMGPDCGTAIINGTPLAFANNVPRGRTGLIGASGTGLQEVACLIARGGGGISQAIGVGGRDLSAAVGGITTLMALDALDRDTDTEHVIIISKPPAPDVATRVIERVSASPKKFTLCFIGADGFELPANATFASTLKAAAESAFDGRRLDLDAGTMTPVPSRPTVDGHIKGLFSGGTLCAEAQVVLLAAGEAVASNVPVAGASAVGVHGGGHTLLDFGNDEYTRGRPHPMIDPEMRNHAVMAALDDPSTGVILLDVVLGHGANENPAGHLHDLIVPRRTPASPAIVASVTGTDDDPQHRSAQVEILQSANITVAPSNADAAALALSCIRGTC